MLLNYIYKMGKLIEVTRIPNRQLDMGMIKAIADETNEIEQDENTVILEYFLSTKLAPANYMGILILMQAIRPSATSAQRHDAIVSEESQPQMKTNA